MLDFILLRNKQPNNLTFSRFINDPRSASRALYSIENCEKKMAKQNIIYNLLQPIALCWVGMHWCHLPSHHSKITFCRPYINILFVCLFWGQFSFLVNNFSLYRIFLYHFILNLEVQCISKADYVFWPSKIYIRQIAEKEEQISFFIY